MRYGRIGGALVIGGWGLVAASVPLSYGPVPGAGAVAVNVAAGIIAAGAALIAFAGPRPLDGRVVRLGLGILAIGLLGFTASSIAAARLTYDPLEDMPTVVLFLGGGLATVVGMLITQLALVRAGGLARRLAACFFGGFAGACLLGVLTSFFGSGPLQLAAGALAVGALIAFMVGAAGPGILVTRRDPASVAAPA
jgi:hypothetical protein